MTIAAASSVAAHPARDLLPRIVTAGLAGGAVDLAYASGMALAGGQPIDGPWRGVASGWIGRGAAEPGAGPVVLGLVTHFAVAAAMAAAYVLLARRIPIVARRPYLTAPVYGLILYAVMYLGVLPLRWPGAFPTWGGVKSVLDILAHVGVALAIAWAAARPAKAR